LWVDGRPVGRRPAPDEGSGAVTFEGLDLAPGRHLVALEAVRRGTPPTDGAAEEAPVDAALALREIEVRETPRVLLVVADPQTSTLRRAAEVQGLLVEAVR